jgi:Lytic transglycolase
MSSARAFHGPRAASARDTGKSVVDPSSHLDGVNLPSHLVAYQAPVSTTTTAPPTTTSTAPPVTTTTLAPRITTTTAPPPAPPPPPPPPPTTTTTTAPPAPANHEVGQATWYAAAPAGYCASPTLPFGTVLTVVNSATGASTVCTVDDREAAGYPRVVDLSPQGFSQIADLGQGVVSVTISW